MTSRTFLNAVERRKLEFWRTLNDDGIYLHEVDVTERPRSIIITADPATLQDAKAVAGRLALSHNLSQDGTALTVRFN